jgi:hypothetical protein
MSYCVKPTRPAFWKPQTLQLDRTDRQLTAQGSFLFHRYEKTTSAFLKLTTRNCKQKTTVYERGISWFRLYSKYRRFKQSRKHCMTRCWNHYLFNSTVCYIPFFRVTCDPHRNPASLNDVLCLCPSFYAIGHYFHVLGYSSSHAQIFAFSGLALLAGWQHCVPRPSLSFCLCFLQYFFLPLFS